MPAPKPTRSSASQKAKLATSKSTPRQQVQSKTESAPVTITVCSDPDADVNASLIGLTATGTVTSKNANKMVASCKAWLIRRDENEGWALPEEEMDEESQELSDLATVLFHGNGFFSRGCLRRRFEHSGTRAWAHELNTAELVFFTDISVNQAFRRQGLGKRMVNDVLSHARGMLGLFDFFPIVCPGVMTLALDEDVRDAGEGADKSAIFAQRKALAIAFWRANGFRRIGTSKYFACAQTPDHPSRHIDDTRVLEDPLGNPAYQSEGDPHEEDYDPEVWAQAVEERIHPDDVDLSWRKRKRDWLEVAEEDCLGEEEERRERKRRDPLHFLV